MPCLEDALTTWKVPLDPNDASRTIEHRSVGIWGATTERNRAAVAKLGRRAAAERLEAELPDRIRARVEAFEARHHRGQASTLAAFEMLDALRAAVTEQDEPAA